MVSLTPLAVSEVKRILEKQPAPGLGLRLGVKGGGCSGLSYAMGFDTPREGDSVFEVEGLKVIVDPKSYLYLDNTVVDFHDGLEGRGFKFVNPNAQKSCGCGESFSV
ncbi:MAG: iron-sulfur cluster assembly accessory protein [Candidatus Omnitrophica bacterium]|nr:iron-sulfur cluster assembly accessory protein [Candidatus Omnitrophota bacterium]